MLGSILNPPEPSRTAPRQSPPLAGRIARACVLLLLAIVLVCTGLLALQWTRGETTVGSTLEKFEVPDDPKRIDAAVATLEKDIRTLTTANLKLRQKIKAAQPRGLYLVIDTGANHLYLMKDETIVRDAIVSTGSGVKLSDPDKPRSWVFDTPRGEFAIQRKVDEPVWTKPDWAFVEAGEDLPRKFGERIEEGVLGDYAMDLGDGYLIHGTLFERALGLHVTHGCVRVGAKDLEAIFKSVKIGTRVYII